MTTANYPDVMMPAYACGDFAAALLFVVYIIITLYFLLSLILAIVYTQFQVRTREKFDKKMAKRAIAFDKVFALLASDDLPESSAGAAAAAGVLGQDTEASHESKGGDSASGMRHRGGDRGGGQGGGFGAGARARGRPTRGRLRLGIHAWLDLMSYVRPDLDNRITKTLFRMVDFEGRGVLTKYQFRQLAAYSTVNATKRRRTSRLQPVSSAAVLRVNSPPSPAAAIQRVKSAPMPSVAPPPPSSTSNSGSSGSGDAGHGEDDARGGDGRGARSTRVSLDMDMALDMSHRGDDISSDGTSGSLITPMEAAVMSSIRSAWDGVADQAGRGGGCLGCVFNGIPRLQRVVVHEAWRLTFDVLVATNTLIILVQFTVEVPGDGLKRSFCMPCRCAYTSTSLFSESSANV